MAGDARNLKVFQRAYRLSLELHRVSLGCLGWNNTEVSRINFAAPPNRFALFWSKAPAVSLVRMPNIVAIFRWRWVRPTKPGCGAITPPILITSPAKPPARGKTNSRRSPVCCTASETACLKTDD